MENPLDKSLGFQMTIAARSMKHALETRLAEHGITSSQYVVLEYLWKNNGISLTDLGKALHFDGPTITGIINRMARSKLIRRARDRKDRRVTKVYYTPKAKELQTILPGLADEVNKKAVQDLTAEERKQILKLAKTIHFNLKNNNRD
ncbi:MarR family winged helix-turn-helix transcriptional regulator [candidate division KSB1 bacterium]